MVNEYEDLILPPPPQFRDQFQLLGLMKQSRDPCLNNARLSNKWLTSTKTSYYHHPQFRDGYKPVPAPRTDKSQKRPRRLPPGGPKAAHFISRRQSELIVQENQKAQKPIRRPPQRPSQPPPQQTKYDYPFNFDDDIFLAENESLGKFKIVSIRSVQNKKFKSFTNEFKVKIFKKLDDAKEIYHIFQELIKNVKKRRKLSKNDMLRFVIRNDELPNAISTKFNKVKDFALDDLENVIKILEI